MWYPAAQNGIKALPFAKFCWREAELELVAKTSGEYYLEDIVVEFVDDNVKSLRASKMSKDSD